jgi:hypothetical protein
MATPFSPFLAAMQTFPMAQKGAFNPGTIKGRLRVKKLIPSLP